MENGSKLISGENVAVVIFGLYQYCVLVTWIGALPTGLWVLWMTYATQT
jgi:hypothetical protein